MEVDRESPVCKKELAQLPKRSKKEVELPLARLKKVEVWQLRNLWRVLELLQKRLEREVK